MSQHKADSGESIAHHKLLADAMAAGESVAVEEDIPGDEPSRGVDKAMQAPAVVAAVTRITLIARRVGVAAGPDQGDAEIRWQMPTEAPFAAAVEVGVDVANRAPRVGDQIRAETAPVSD